MLRGGEEILDHLCAKLGICPGQTTPDGAISLEVAECLGACEGAPCALLNDEHRLNLTAQSADVLVEKLQQKVG